MHAACSSRAAARRAPIAKLLAHGAIAQPLLYIPNWGYKSSAFFNYKSLVVESSMQLACLVFEFKPKRVIEAGNSTRPAVVESSVRY
jgi:hypothetical protein